MGRGIHRLPLGLKGTCYMTEDSDISNCLMNKTIRYMAVFGHIKSAFECWGGGVIPSPALNGTFYMTEDGHIKNNSIYGRLRSYKKCLLMPGEMNPPPQDL